MGADLYIKNLPKEYQITGFRTDVAAGYFRDAYNDSNLLWLFGFSYWSLDKLGLVNKDWEMSPEQAQKLLGLLKEKEKIFKAKAVVLAFAHGEKNSKKTIAYFNDKYKEFKKFLKLAIKLKSNIDCSV